MSWDDLADRMDALVDDKLGDALSYSQGGAPAATVMGFVLDYDAVDGVPSLDTLGKRMRIKVNKTLVPVISRNDRIAHWKLGASTWRPEVDKIETQGRYWLFDIQKV